MFGIDVKNQYLLKVFLLDILYLIKMIVKLILLILNVLIVIQIYQKKID